MLWLEFIDMPVFSDSILKALSNAHQISIRGMLCLLSCALSNEPVITDLQLEWRSWGAILMLCVEDHTGAGWLFLCFLCII